MAVKFGFGEIHGFRGCCHGELPHARVDADYGGCPSCLRPTVRIGIWISWYSFSTQRTLRKLQRLKYLLGHQRISSRGIWKKTGIFSVRSAYNLALRLKQGEEIQSSSSAPDGERKLWSRVWSGQVPPKVNVFIWKLAKDKLPTRRAKFIRRLEASDICP